MTDSGALGTITTTASTWINDGTACSADWYVTISEGTGFSVCNDPLEALRSDFKKLSTKFFDKHETEYHHGERLDRYYNRKADNEAIASLMS